MGDFLLNQNNTVDFGRFKFSPVVNLPADYEVYDLTTQYDPSRKRGSPYGIGRYNEQRRGMYTSALFKDPNAEELRDIHVGIDIACPVGEPVHAFYEGAIFLVGINPAEGDYGGTIITQHDLAGTTLWALYGHLSHASVYLRVPGTRISAGEIVGQVGDRSENGGWNPHLHFQLSWECPQKPDLPGVVSKKDLGQALKTFPDPRLVLGQLYK